MSQLAKEILREGPVGETRIELIDRVLQMEADRCSEIIEGCAPRHADWKLRTVLIGLCIVLRVHLGQGLKDQDRERLFKALPEARERFQEA